jgi:hypothetical protein
MSCTGRPRAWSERSQLDYARSDRAGGGSERRDPHLPKLDLAAPVRGASARPADSAAAELVGLHGDVALASATL